MLKGTDGEPAAISLSPGKKAWVSGQYLEHLERLKTLRESGVLTNEEFDEQKKFALNSIRRLND